MWLCCQSAYGGYVYSYAVKSIVDLDPTEGAYLNALFWVSDTGYFAIIFSFELLIHQTNYDDISGNIEKFSVTN